MKAFGGETKKHFNLKDTEEFKMLPHSIRNKHETESMVCILAQSPLPYVHVAVD